MVFELSVLGLVFLPLAAGITVFAVGRWGPPLTIIVGLIQPFFAAGVARSIWQNGPSRYRIGGWGAPLGIDLHVDGIGALMVLMTAVVGLMVAIYARSYFATTESEPANQSSMFWPVCLLLWTGLNALYLSGDIFNFYVALEMLVLSAVALIGLGGKPKAVDAALHYVIYAVTASLFYLMGLTLLYSMYGTVDWAILGTRVEPNFSTRCSIVLMTVGLLMKTALFPLHFWLPAAHGSAPAPASAMLSGLVLKASFFVLLRLWYNVFPYEDLRAAGDFLGILGAAAIIWGSVKAIIQQRLKLLIAYSTVAQMGYLFLFFSIPHESPYFCSAWSGTWYFAVSHACAKAAAFMAVGSLAHAAGSDQIKDMAGMAQHQPVAVFAFGLSGVSLMGLPLSGAFVAKWMLLKSTLASGHWHLTIAILAGGLMAAIYIVRVLATAFAVDSRSVRNAPAPMQWPPLILACLSAALGLVAYYPMKLLEIGAPCSAILMGVTP